MATYTTSNRLIKPATNEYRNTWGTEVNGGLIDMVDALADGVTTLALTGNVTLTTANGASDQARNRVINVTSSDAADRTITIPAVAKWYLVENEAAQRIKIKTAAGTAVTVPAYCSAIVRCDGTDCFKLLQPDYGLISTTSPTSGTTITLTLTGFDCKNFLLTFKGLTSSTGNNLQAEFSSDNSTWTTAGVISLTGGANPYYGQMQIERATEAAGMVSFAIEALSSNNTVDTSHGSGTSQIWPWRLSGGILYVRLGITSGTYTTGSVEVWGR